MLNTVSTASSLKNLVLRYIRLLLVNQFTTSLVGDITGWVPLGNSPGAGKEAHLMGYFDPMRSRVSESELRVDQAPNQPFGCCIGPGQPATLIAVGEAPTGPAESLVTLDVRLRS